MKLNVRNEKVKRGFIRQLLRAQGKSEKTVESILPAIYEYDDFTQNVDYEYFSERKAIKFKDYLASTRNGKGRLSASTIRRHLKSLQAFFRYLSDCPGYRKHIRSNDIDFLSPDNEHFALNLTDKPKRVPSLEYVKRLVSSIVGDGEIAMRDRAMISALCLTGMRDNALVSLPIGSVELDKNRITQDPRQFTRTKFRKMIVSYIFQIDADLVKHFVIWIQYLREEKLFSDCDPIFPITKVGQSENGFTFESKGVSRTFCSSSSIVRSVLKNRSKDAGLEYYIPHSYRWLTVRLAMTHCRTPEQFKAISLSLGHEAVTTTLRSYGTLDAERIEEVIGAINFESIESDNSAVERLLKAAIKEVERGKKSG